MPVCGCGVLSKLLSLIEHSILNMKKQVSIYFKYRLYIKYRCNIQMCCVYVPFDQILKFYVKFG